MLGLEQALLGALPEFNCQAHAANFVYKPVLH